MPPGAPLAIVSLDRLEEILYRETSIIASEDVAILMVVVYQEVGAEVPERIVREAEANNGG